MELNVINNTANYEDCKTICSLVMEILMPELCGDTITLAFFFKTAHMLHVA